MGWADALVEALPDAVFRVRRDGVVLDCKVGQTSEMAAFISPQDLIGARASERLPPDAAAVVTGGVEETLGTGEVVSRLFDTSTGSASGSYWEGRFSTCGPDEALIVLRDVTEPRCRGDAERLMLELGRSLLAATPATATVAVEEALRRTASFVGARGGMMLLPEDGSPQDFSIEYAWSPLGIAEGVPELDPGVRSWLQRYLEHLDEPAVVETAALPRDAPILHWVAREYGLAALGLIPVVWDAKRAGVIIFGYPTPPERVGRLRLAAMGSLGHLLCTVRERNRREGEAWLRATENHFRSMVRHSADITLVVDEAAELIFISPAIADVLGYEPEDLLGKNVFEYVHPDDVDDAVARFASVGPGRQGRTLRIRHADGSWHWLESVMSDQRDDPAIAGFVAITRDVTERVVAEEALRESEERLRRLAERASDMLYRYRLLPEPGFEYVSPAAEVMTGFSPQEFCDDPSLLLDRLHPDDRSSAGAQLWDTTTDRRRLRLRVQHRDGSWLWTEHRTVPVFDDDGTLIAAEGIARDITDQVRAEADLLESEELSRSVLESIAGPTAVLDATGSILMVNHAWNEYIVACGAEASDCGVGAAYLELCDDSATNGVPAAGEIAAGVRAVLAGAQESFRLDYPAPGPDDDRWFVIRVSPLRTGFGGVVILHTDITERKEYEQQLSYQALHDALTGLPNRALLADRLDLALRRAARVDPTVAVLLLDLDRFKVVNDALGHAAGDELLVEISERLTRVVRPSDTVARFGGDEFVVLCEGVTDEQEVASIAERMVDGLVAPLGRQPGVQSTVTASIGIALGGAGTRGDTLLRDADAAMYHAKERGRNRFEFFDQRLHTRAVSRLAVEAELRHALEDEELRLFYQPVVNLRTLAIEGVEALVRWQHPTRGLLAPAEFLGVAEETDLIVPIGAWVLREAARQHECWRALRPHGELTIAVNISAQQMRRSTFANEVLAVAGDADLLGGDLVLEITETVLMESNVLPVVTRLNDAGVSLAVDDFGVAYSSLSYLKRFPVDTVKIDQAFVDGVGHDPDDTAIVDAIVGMTRALGLTVIAEGVETQKQHDELVALGCDHGQGFLFSPARPAEEITAMLESEQSGGAHFPDAEGPR